MVREVRLERLHPRELHAAMADAARTVGAPDAASRLADLVEAVATRKEPT